MAHAVRGFPLLLVYSGGFSAICSICHFNASVRRFNVWGYPSLYRRRPAWSVLSVCGFMARRCPMLRGLPLVWCAASLPPFSFPCCFVGGGLLRRCGLGGLRWLLRRSWLSAKFAGKVAKVAGIVVPLCAKVAGKVASACAKVAHFTPKS